MAKKKANSTPQTQTKIDKTLTDNFVLMQKVLTNLSVKFEDLSDNISKLLQLFEVSAKNFVEKTDAGEYDKNSKGFSKQLDKLIKQNEDIVKAINLLEKPTHQEFSQPPEFRPPQQKFTQDQVKDTKQNYY